MASQEHLQQLNHDDSSTSSSSSEELLPPPPPQSTSTTTTTNSKSAPPKMRLKIRMPKAKPNTPGKAKPATTKKTAKPSKSSSLAMKKKKIANGDPTVLSIATTITEEPVVATVVDSSDVDDDADDEAGVVEVLSTTTATTTSKTKNNNDNGEDDDDDDDDDDEEDTVLAALVIPKSSSSSLSASKKRAPPVRPVQMPALTSPGLLIPPSAGVYRGDADQNGFTTPSSVFDHHMLLAGYTTERRREFPHRGSSVQRQVGDMFDTDVTLTLLSHTPHNHHHHHHTPLIPKDLAIYQMNNNNNNKNGNGESNHHHHQQQQQQEDNTNNNTNEAPNENGTVANGHNPAATEAFVIDRVPDLFSFLERALSTSWEDAPPKDSNVVSNGRKRKRPWDLKDMVPLSLTLPYPESYLDKHQAYMEKVRERERAIVATQEAELAKEAEKEKDAKKIVMETTPPPPEPPPKIKIPPIPRPPTPPSAAEMEKVLDMEELDDSQHPLYFPKGKEEFVEHLDKRCFHVTEGRYFGLLSNRIADPHFVGPNAPGITGLSVSAGTGLATSHVGNSSTGSASLASTVYGQKDSGGNSKSSKKKSQSVSSSSAGGGGAAASSSSSGAGALGNHKKGPAPTSSASDLKKIMERGGSVAEEMRMCIMRAAVYASRTGRHGQSFVGPNGETYPDVAKAFAAHAGLRPCLRCKNNKQGVSCKRERNCVVVVVFCLDYQKTNFLICTYRPIIVDCDESTRIWITTVVTAPHSWLHCLRHPWKN